MENANLILDSGPKKSERIAGTNALEIKNEIKNFKIGDTPETAQKRQAFASPRQIGPRSAASFSAPIQPPYSLSSAKDKLLCSILI